MMATSVHPLTSTSSSSVQDFAQALVRSGSRQLFSVSEKRMMGVIAFLAFSVTLGGLGFATLADSSSNSLSASSTSISLAKQYQENDEEALAQYFLTRAHALLAQNVTPIKTQEASLLLEQAEAQLALSDKQTSLVASLREQVMVSKQQLGVQQESDLPSPEVTTVQRIAAPAQTGAQVEVSSLVTSNASEHAVTFPQGATEVWVPYAQLQADAQVYVTPVESTNEIIYVKSKQAGNGFTLAVTAPLSKETQLTWYEIAQE